MEVLTLSERRNVVAIATEAHRSQYDLVDSYARHSPKNAPQHQTNNVGSTTALIQGRLRTAQPS